MSTYKYIITCINMEYTRQYYLHKSFRSVKYLSMVGIAQFWIPCHYSISTWYKELFRHLSSGYQIDQDAFTANIHAVKCVIQIRV